MRLLCSFLIVVVLSLLSPSPGFAQTNPCDRPQITTDQTVSSASQTFVVCAPAADAIDGINVYVGGVKSDVGLPVAGAASASGKVPYSVSVTLPSKGKTTVQTSTYTLSSTGTKQEGAKSIPFAYVWEKAVPSAPTNHPSS